MIRQSIIRVARNPLFSSLVTLLEKLEHRPNLLRVLTYHRVNTPDARPDLNTNLVSATPDQFARQMEHVASRACVVTIDQILQAVQNEAPLPPRSVLITFDDAYRDFLDHAWPTLQRLGLPAVMFVPTAFPDRPRSFWWDTVYAAVHHGRAVDLSGLGVEVAAGEAPERIYRHLSRQLKSLPHDVMLHRVAELADQAGLPEPSSAVMTWEELKNLAKNGLTLGAHTRTHPLLNRVPIATAIDEAVTSLHELQAHVPAAPPILAYPGGAFSREVVDGLRPHFQLAFTTCRGISDLRRADALRLRRINVSRHTPGSLMRAQMLSGIRYFNRRWPLESAV